MDIDNNHEAQRYSVITTTATPKNDDIDEEEEEDENDPNNKKSPYASIDIPVDPLEPKRSTSGHTRIGTESMEMATLAAGVVEEKEIMSALDDIQERENESTGDEINDTNKLAAQIVLQQTDNDKKEEEKSPSLDGDSEVHESGDTSQPTTASPPVPNTDNNGIEATNPPQPINTKIRVTPHHQPNKSSGQYRSPKLSLGSDFGIHYNNRGQIKLFPVHKLPTDDVFEPILSSKNWRIRRRFYFKRFIVSLLCGIFLPIVLILQTLAFWFYIEGKRGGFYYPSNIKYDDIHHGILFDFLGIVIGRKPDQDPEIKKDRKWFLRQNWKQKLMRIILTIWVCIVYFVCFFNAEQHTDESLRVSLMETFGPIMLLCVLWIMLSLWIAHESNLKPSTPPLTRLRSVFFTPYTNNVT